MVKINGKKLKDLRISRGWTLAIAAAHWSDALGATVSHQIMERVEAGQYVPNLGRFVALVRIYEPGWGGEFLV